MKKINYSKKIDGFTLTELMVVLVIIGILTLMVLPNLMDNVVDAYRTETGTTYANIKSKQDVFRMKNFRYANSLEELKFKANDKYMYEYSIRSADKTTFVLQAQAKEDFDGDGDIDLITFDQEGNQTIEQED
jgi:type IV pilus assembly protein PilE